MAGFLASSSFPRRRNLARFVEFIARWRLSYDFLPIRLDPHRHFSVDRSEGRIHGGGGFRLEIVDDEAWKLSSALAQADFLRPSRDSVEESVLHVDCRYDAFDFDQIEDLRLRKGLIYKLDRDSMENEECSISLFNRQKSKSKKKEIVEDQRKPPKNSRSEENSSSSTISAAENCKRERIPTFNQLTNAYHFPFCLDIFISKGSVRACIIHRSTSKVVSVAHSISKDMKFDLSSRKNTAACAAVGAALAQRALSDDIHNVVYTPRKGEKIEGKLQIVLQSIVDSGIDVKIKIKQRKSLKGRRFFP
ncbi:ribosomal L18p/L5e family protein [Wolffia australiana]